MSYGTPVLGSAPLFSLSWGEGDQRDLSGPATTDSMRWLTKTVCVYCAGAPCWLTITGCPITKARRRNGVGRFVRPVVAS